KFRRLIMAIASRGRNETQMDKNQTSHTSLPTEILKTIIEYLDEIDRARLSSLNQQLRSIEKITGHRRFSTVELRQSYDAPTLEVRTRIQTHLAQEKSKSFGEDDTAKGFCEFFKEASTDVLKIKEFIHGEAVPQLHRVLSALKLNELNYGITDENVFKQMFVLIKTFKQIKSVRINWNVAYTNDLIAKPLILNLPPTDEYTFISQHSQMFIDNEVLMHMINSSRTITKIICPFIGVTRDGLERAFEKVYRGERERFIEFPVSIAEHRAFLSRAYSSQYFERRKNGIKHMKSGASLSVSVRFNGGGDIVTIRHPRIV
ncbi:hypothetical protein PRIPAC_87887, partial [Pristionchus pacificus]|uniref:F-box domain-containing protein n=1 Tax=Pristionchus pacificus TaxID=54126 RepID=A0A2A6B6C5_PRIPA